jgi:hypothetical protein
MNKKSVYSELKEIVCTACNYEIQLAVLKEIHETGYMGLSFVYDYNGDGDVSGVTITLRYKHTTGEKDMDS